MNLLLRYWDAVLVLQNIVVAAESLGLGTVYIGDAPGMHLHERLGLPENVFPAGLVLIGHPDGKRPEKARYRLPMEAVVHRNRYLEPTEDQLEDWHDRYTEMFEKRHEELPDVERERLAADGIENGLQRFCRGVAEYFAGVDAAVLENLRRGGFRVADWGTRE